VAGNKMWASRVAMFRHSGLSKLSNCSCPLVFMEDWFQNPLRCNTRTMIFVYPPQIHFLRVITSLWCHCEVVEPFRGRA
jgi:hypothetical protein